MKIEFTTSGELALQLSRDPDDFRWIAEWIREKLGGTWSQQLDHHDQSYWDLNCRVTKLTVHREHYLGVSVLCSDTPTNRELLERLGRDRDTISEA